MQRRAGRRVVRRSPRHELERARRRGRAHAWACCARCRGRVQLFRGARLLYAQHLPLRRGVDSICRPRLGLRGMLKRGVLLLLARQSSLASLIGVVSRLIARRVSRRDGLSCHHTRRVVVPRTRAARHNTECAFFLRTTQTTRASSSPPRVRVCLRVLPPRGGKFLGSLGTYTVVVRH